MAEILVTAIIARATGTAVARLLRSSQSKAMHAQSEAQLASSRQQNVERSDALASVRDEHARCPETLACVVNPSHPSTLSSRFLKPALAVVRYAPYISIVSAVSAASHNPTPWSDLGTEIRSTSTWVTRPGVRLPLWARPLHSFVGRGTR
jgi:hypothetical protein